MYFVRAKIGIKNGLILRARIKGIGRKRGSQGGPHIRSGRQGRWIGQASGERLQEPERRCGGNVQEDVVERRIIDQSITAANCRLAMAGDGSAPLWLIGESNHGTVAVLHRRNGRVGPHGKRQRLQPESGGRIAFAFRGGIGEQLCWVSIIGPRQAQVDRKVLADLPVVATIKEGVIFAEVQDRVARGDLDAVWRAVDEAAKAAITISAVDVGQERVGGALIGPVHTRLERVLAPNVVKVVLRLPRVHQASLGEVGRGTKAQESALNGYVGQRVEDASLCGLERIANVVAAEIHIQAVEAHANFVHYVRSKVVGFADQGGLAQSRYVGCIAGNRVIAAIEVVAAVKDVAAHNAVVAKLAVYAVYKVKTVERSREDAEQTGRLHARAAGYGQQTGCSIHVGIARAYSIRTKLLQQGKLLCRGTRWEASRKSCQAGRSRSLVRGGKDAVSGEQIAVKSAKNEPLVLQYRAADGAAAELFIAAQRTSQGIALHRCTGSSGRHYAGYRSRQAAVGAWLILVLLRVGHRVQEVAVLGPEYRTMPGVGPGFRDDVDHGPGVAAVFRSKIVRDDHVLLHEVRVAHEK